MVDWCDVYEPNSQGLCRNCGRTFEEQCAQFGVSLGAKRLKDVSGVEDRLKEAREAPPMESHKPWCHIIVKLGDHACNCVEPGQKEISMLKSKPCERWRESLSGNCLCGLPWAQHTLKARNGWLTKDSFKPAVSRDAAVMTDQEAAEWVLSLGRNHAERISKIQDLLRNATTDNMSKHDQVFLEQILKVLQHAQPPPEEKQAGKHPCPQCGVKRSEKSATLCKPCLELAVEDADELPLSKDGDMMPDRFD